MKQKNYANAMRSALILAVVLSVCLAGSVPMIVLGAVNGIIPVMVLGIVCAVCGFYGSPLAWVGYSSLRAYRGMYGLIIEDGVESVPELASTLGLSEDVAVKQLSYLINKRYLVGYVLDLAAKVVRPPARRVVTGKCPNCGAALVPTENGAHCPYCGADYTNR